jgi:hypothetical protein
LGGGEKSTIFRWGGQSGVGVGGCSKDAADVGGSDESDVAGFSPAGAPAELEAIVGVSAADEESGESELGAAVAEYSGAVVDHVGAVDSHGDGTACEGGVELGHAPADVVEALDAEEAGAGLAGL